MTKNEVNKLYAIGNAKWYDYFKNIWNKLVASKAEEELANFLKNSLDKNKTILELGCGTALNLQKIFSLRLKFKEYLGLDFSKDMLRIAKEKFKNNPKIKFKEKDISKLNIKNKYDIIICTWVLSHLQSPSTVINIAQKLLKKNGKMFIIFFSEPKWYVKFWLSALAKMFFKANYVANSEVNKFNNVCKKQKYSSNIVTTIQIKYT